MPWHIGHIADIVKSIRTLVADSYFAFNPLNPELNPICYLLALLGAHHLN